MTKTLMPLHQFEHRHRVIFLFTFLASLLFLNSCSIQGVFVNDKLATSHVENVDKDDIVQSVFLIGDAGKPSLEKKEPVLAALEREASKYRERGVIVFLGDNVYPKGMPKESHDERPFMERRLNELVSVVEQSGATGIFIPGNHDWGEWSDDGLESVKRQNEFLEAKKNTRIRMSPQGGTPGPDIIDIGAHVRLVVLDTEWWLHGNPKPLYPNTHDENETKKAITDSLEKVLKSAGNRYVIVVGHHPLESHGTHSGFFDWRDHIFPLREIESWLLIPLPVVGSMYPLIRNLGISNQDMSGSKYEEMKHAFENVFSQHPPLVYAAGHEHTLEVLESDDEYLILVSGYGTSKHDPSLTHADHTLFAHRHTGFMRIDILIDQRVRLGVIEPRSEGEKSEEVFSMWIRQ
ncbi:MAG: metallophosphoesterase [Ignavibacteriae bacterium]|nr:metallophosphoesterase [Ignavibacteriota bacterium]